MGKRFRFKNVLWVAVCLLMVSKCFAGIDTHIMSASGPFTVDPNNSIIGFHDAKFNPADWATISSQTSQNTVSLKVNDNVPITFSFSYSIKVHIDCFADPNNLNTVSSSFTQDLSVDYNPGKGFSYKGMDSFTVPNNNTYKVNIYVIAINSNSSGAPQPTAGMVSLNYNITVSRQYNFSKTAVIPSIASSFVNGTDDSGNGNKQLSLSWGTVLGAEDYDVEWTTIDRGDDDAVTAASMFAGNAPSSPIGELFKNNATRISTSDQSYKISMVYDDDYLLVRIRQVQYDAATGIRMEGDWNYLCTNTNANSTGTYLVWDLKPPGGTGYAYHPNRNYQYAAAFAEEGKKKEVISFFDGTLRNRQTVTIDNLVNIPIVQENVYDEFGRPAASILPAPTLPDGSGVSLKYHKLFNLYAGGVNNALVPYDFKGLKATLAPCENAPTQLDASKGAAQYYSSANPFMSAINTWAANSGTTLNPYPTLKNTNYIPDAQQFPFSVTQYTPDNTGRIKLQGGVGAAFQPGNPNPNNYANSKVTRYFYGKPEQWELDRLFGNDVGYAEHYFKNMVVDPNNQISISYVNASGKTIATALTGLVPGAVDALPSASDPASTTNPTVQVLNPKQFQYDPSGLKLSASTTYLASNTGLVNFSYSMQQLVYSIVSNTNSASVCSNCYYDLHIMVYDACKTQVYDQIKHVGAKLNNGNDAAATSCGPNTAYADNFNATFSNIGEYYISFEFVFSKSALEDYVNKYIDAGQLNGLVKKQWSFLYPLLQGLDFTGCLNDCKTNLQTLGDEDDFRAMFDQKLLDVGVDPSILVLGDYTNYVHTTYSNLHAYCLSTAGSCDLSPCSKYESIMERDVSPGGQYALYNGSYLPLEPAINVLYQNWRTVFPILPPGNANYQAELVNKYDAAYIVGNVTVPPVATVTSPYDASFTFADLIKYWKTEWAVKFLPYHPEYCKLTFCYMTNNYHNWDERIMAIDQASDLGTVAGSLITPVYNTTVGDWLVNSDPFFGTNSPFSGITLPGHSNNLKTEFRNDLNNYSQNVLHQTPSTSMPVKNLSQIVDYILYAASLQQADPNTNYWLTYDASACRMIDRNWAEYKNYYFDLKQKYYDLASQAVTCPFVCPIGQPISMVGGNSCPQATDFMISPLSSIDVTAAGTPASGYKWVTVTYLPGKMPNDATLNLYYPTISTGSNVGLAMATGDSKGFLAIPITIPVNTVKIQSVTCSYGAMLNYNDRLKNGRYVYDDGHGVRYEYFIKAGRANEKPRNLIDSIGDKATRPNYYSSVTLNSLKGGETVKLDHVWLAFTFTTYDVGDHQKGSAGDEVITLPANTAYLGGAPVTQNQNNNTTTAKALIQPLAGTGAKQANKLPALTDGGCGPGDTDFYISGYQSATSGGQAGLLFYVKLKPQFDQCPRANDIPFTLSVKYENNPDINPTITETGSGNLDRYTLAGSVFIPMTNFTSVSLCGNIGPCSGNSTCNSAYQYKQSRFLSISQDVPYETDYVSATARGQAAITLQMQNTCIATAPIWIKALNPGLGVLQSTYSLSNGDIATLQTNLQNGLIGICQGGGNFEHPFGSSTLSNNGNTTIPTPIILPSSSGTNNFGDVILQNISQLNGKFTDGLNPWLISGPGPYFPVSPSGPITVSYTSADINNAITAIQNQAGGQNLYQYMVDNYGAAMTLSLADLNTLIAAYNHCNNLLPYDITIPVFLQKPGLGSISAATYNATKSNLAQYFSDSGSWPNTPNYKQIITTFLNQSFGFLLTYDQYKAYETLISDPNHQNAILCNNPPFKSVAGNDYDCISAVIDNAANNALSAYNTYIDDQKNMFRAGYIATCAAAKPSVNMQTSEQQYHYTLYYYDQADNLVRTVPPEGVNLITNAALLQQVRDARDNPNASNCAGNGNMPTVASTASTAFAAVETLLQTAPAAGQAIEMWLYNPNNQPDQVIEQTVNNKYLFHLCMSGNFLNVDIFTSTPTVINNVNTGITYTLSQHYGANISSLMPLGPWQHVVIQGHDMAKNGMQVYLNGTLLTALANPPPAACSYSVTATSGGVTYPDHIDMLKHLRVYNRLLDPITEIKPDADNSCFFPVSAYDGWFRFHIPSPGTATTIAQGSSIESKHSSFYPNHDLTTTYVYNSTNQVVRQNSPDGGQTFFWYDMLSRLIASQNAKQAALGQQVFSYTQFDALGRIIEVGQKTNAPTFPGANGMPGYLDNTFVQNLPGTGTNSEITHTYYDEAAPVVFAGTPNPNGIATITQQDNLRKRVAATTYTDVQGHLASQATYYDYDIDGNVKTLWQQIDGLTDYTDVTKLKRIDYEYDLVSGKVNFVRYQDGRPDKFYYKYAYDAENRLQVAMSGPDAMVDAYNGSYLLDYSRRQNAAYYYYAHGPLARVELGDVGSIVQGIDYAYTLQGWLKGVNGANLNNDMWKDGRSGAYPSSSTIKDAYAYSLGYYAGDYKPIGGGNAPAFDLPYQEAIGDITGQSLYNGNITNTTLEIGALNNGAVGYTYRYDQLNRLRKMRQHNDINNQHAGLLGNGWDRNSMVFDATQVHSNYGEDIDYDGNGNILHYKRQGAGAPTASNLMDSLSYGYSYFYKAGDPKPHLVNNRLRHVIDNLPDANGFTTDLKLQSADNYQYDAIGNMVRDAKEDIIGNNGKPGIEWTVYGKIAAVNKSNSSINYYYNTSAQRVSKLAAGLTTWYVRDAQGNTMGVYDNANSTVNWREQHLYGSSRLGMWTPNINLATANAATEDWKNIGHTSYELNNHLDNVLATITDKRIQNVSGSGTNQVIDNYNADVVTAQDYYPFGMQMEGRTAHIAYDATTQTYNLQNGAGNYRYGFNGKENDNEVKGTGNQQDYGMRIYDPRVGRFLSVDPITAKYPELTPYQFAGNTPIQAIDLDGLEPWIPYRKWTEGYDKAGVGAVFVNVIANTVLGVVNTVAAAGIGAKDLSVHTYKVVTGQAPVHTSADDIIDAIHVYKKIKEKATKVAHQPVEKTASRVFTGITSPETYGNVVGFFAMGGGEFFFAKVEVGFAGFGGNILVNEERTTTILGRFKGAIENLKNDGAFGRKKLNFLNVSTDLTGEAFFNKFNVPFLEEAAARNDIIRFVSDPTKIENLIQANGEPTMFGREIDWLKNNGYKIEGSTATKIQPTGK